MLLSSYFYLGNFQEALNAHQKALDIRRELFGEKHLGTADSYSWLGITYSRLGDKNKAVEYLQKAIDIARQKLGENHQTTRQYIQILQQIQAQ